MKRRYGWNADASNTILPPHRHSTTTIGGYNEMTNVVAIGLEDDKPNRYIHTRKVVVKLLLYPPPLSFSPIVCVSLKKN